MIKVSWVPGAVDVPGHRITYSTNHGSDIKQMEVKGQNSVLVQSLSSLSRYLVSVQSHYPQGLSATLTSNVTTHLRVTNFSGSEFTVRWEAAADDVVYYLIKWISLNEGDLRQLKVNGDNDGAILEGVEEDKEYQISLSALYGDGAQSEAVAIRYSTCKRNCSEHGGQLAASKCSRPPLSRVLHTTDGSRDPGQNCEKAVNRTFLAFLLFAPKEHKSLCCQRETTNHLACVGSLERLLYCLQVLVPGGHKQVVLESLQPDTRYSILVTAEYRNREGGSGSAQGKTSK
ncbi:hypothetical protein GOODEAATRI_003211 [Goodea atripinnis]|uniref:Fibronectin type-III domain-containing protein n=1 Tax=Goodea atripinnis TaxID=208336 RepID=A0ABV0PKR5_9TELE